MQYISIFIFLSIFGFASSQDNQPANDSTNRFILKKHIQDEANSKARALSRQLMLGKEKMTSTEGRNYNVHYYNLNLDIDPDAKYIIGSLELKAVVKNSTISALILDFSNFLTVESVVYNSSSLPFSHESALLSITLDKTYSENEAIELIVYYQGNSDFGGSSFFGDSFGQINIDGKPMIWSLSVPYSARDWWPCKDTAEDKPDSMDIFYTVPEEMIAASNGRLVSKTISNNKATFHWKLDYPIAPYLVCLNAYEFVEHNSEYISSLNDTLPITFYVTPSHFEATKTNFDLIPDYIGIYASLFGEYPFMNEKFAQAETPIGGGMEHQTMVALGDVTNSAGQYSSGLIAHELSHMWWGDMITCASFKDVWLNEGFATYSEALIREAVEGKEAYFEEMNFNAYKGQGTIYVPDTTDAFRIFNGNLSYAKASWVLHMLRKVTGDSSFFEIFKSWYADPLIQYSTATTADFQNIAEKVSGLKLEKFFQQWIYGEYFPKYSYGFKSQESGDQFIVTVFIDQIQDNTGLFWMPIDLQMISGTDTITYSILDSLQSQQFEFSLPFSPEIVELDPHNWILKETKAKLIEPSLNQGILLVNGLKWNMKNVWESYDNKAFWGSAPITFWDLFDEPANGYPETLPTPIGHGEIPPEVFGTYSSIIWLSHKNGGDFEIWQREPVLDYLNAGGNLFLSTRTGQDFINEPMREYLGITWDEKPLLLIKDYISVQPELLDMPLISNQAFIALFDTSLTQEHSTLLFKTKEGFDLSKGSGVWSKPDSGGNFVYLAGRPWLFEYDTMRVNMTYILDEIMGETVVSIQNESNILLPDRFVLSNIYPNPFNPTTHIDFALPESRKVTITVFDIVGKKVATLLNNQNYKAGTFSIKWNASPLASGLYFIQVQAGNELKTRKALLMK